MPSEEHQGAKIEPIEPRYLGLGELFYRIRDAVIVGDAQTGRVVLWNESAARLFGYDSQESLDLLIEDLVPESLKDAHRSGLRQYAETGRGTLIDSARIVELPAVRKDGSEVLVELSLTPLESNRLAGRYALAIVRDVTQRKEAEEKMQAALDLEREATERLRRLDELRNTFIATMAHDVRSPMAAVIGFAELLREDWHRIGEDVAQRALEAIARSAGRVGRLVDDVLEVAALDAGGLTFKIEPFDLATTLTHATNEAQAAHPGIEFDLRVPSSPLPPVLGDPGRTWQIITNLLSNAANFTPNGERIEISSRTNLEMVEVSVRDHGPGLSDDDQAKLFGKFSLVEGQGQARRERGTGLGLYLCRTIVEAQGGRIWVVSAPGAGATFSFTVPLAEGRRQEPDPHGSGS